uniref:Uncharacterized protein n=1 Tax=Anguilla anguilla TaxID=7936 RepID=A0A0E9WP26_ANGAN
MHGALGGSPLLCRCREPLLSLVNVKRYRTAGKRSRYVTNSRHLLPSEAAADGTLMKRTAALSRPCRSRPSARRLEDGVLGHRLCHARSPRNKENTGMGGGFVKDGVLCSFKACFGD